MSQKISSYGDSIESYLKIAASFSTAKLGLLVVRHPLHVVQINKQAFPGLKNSEIISNIYRQSGIKGFYRATSASILKILAAESYRGVLMIKIPEMVRSHLSKPWIDSSTIATTITTSLIATPIISLIDTTIICPFIRLATLQITIEQNSTLKNIYNTYIKGDAVKQLYRGYTPLLIQTSLLWANFFVIDDIIKYVLRNYFRTTTYSSVALASVAGGAVQTLVNVVPDTIRVQMQKIANRNLNMRNITKNLVQQHGVRSLFSVVPHKLAGGILNYGYKSVLRHFWTSNLTE